MGEGGGKKEGDPSVEGGIQLCDGRPGGPCETIEHSKATMQCKCILVTVR